MIDSILFVLAVALIASSISFMLIQEMDASGGGLLSWFAIWRNRTFKDRDNGNYHPIASLLGKCAQCFNFHVTWVVYGLVCMLFPDFIPMELSTAQVVLLIIPLWGFSNIMISIWVRWFFE
jgi:hypothetical protein